MTDEQKVAYVQSQSLCAFIETQAMIVANKEREAKGEALAYDEKAFRELFSAYSINHNEVIGLFYD